MKLLLLNVFAAMAITCSSFGQHAKEIARGTNENEQVAPRMMAPQYLDKSETESVYSLANVEQNYAEAVSSEANAAVSFDPEVAKEAKIDGKIDDFVIQKPILTGPVFDPNPGSGGGSTSSGLTTYPEKDSEYEFDDYACTAKIVGDRGILKGRIVQSHESDQINTYGARPGIDKDFFRFSIHEERKYNFNLYSAPGLNYYYEIYRFSTNYADNDSLAGMPNHTLLYSSRYSSRQHEMTLRAGTYFVCFTSATLNGIRPELDYEFSFDYSYVEDTFESISLTDAMRYNYDVITWESECAPYNVNHFTEEPPVLCVYRDTASPDIYLNYYKGYLDPIEMEYENSWTAPAYDLVTREDYRLDSVVYLLNQSTISSFKDQLNRMRYKIEDTFRDKYVASIKVQREESVIDCITGVVGIGISIVATCFSGNPGWLGMAAAYCETLGFVMDGVDLMIAVAQALSFSTGLSHLVSGYSIGCNITNLYERCKDILNGTEPNKIIAIPRYSSVYTEQAPYDSEYPLGTRYAKIAFSPFIPGIFSDDYFYFPKNGTIRRYQKPIFDNSGNCQRIQVSSANPDGTFFKGKMKFFESYYDFDYYKEYGPGDPDEREIVEGALQPKGTYNIGGSASSRSLIAWNFSGQTIKLAYSNVSISDWQGENFNIYNKDGYTYVDIPNNSYKIISLGSRSAIYIRENNDNFVTKISYMDGRTVFSDPIIFGTEYLKLAVVTSSWSWFVRTWTIRVRNLFNKAITFYYNKKMCFTNDAKNWSGLKDWTNTATTIQPHSYVDIKISENGTADAIGVSWVETSSNTRYISYANSLNWSSNTLSYKTNAIGI